MNAIIVIISKYFLRDNQLKYAAVTSKTAAILA